MIPDLNDGEGGNEVPVEGIWINNRAKIMYCDDVVVVRDEQVIRLCVIIRVLTAILTMELGSWGSSV